MKPEPGSVIISDLAGRMGDVVWQKRKVGAGIRSYARTLASHPRKKHGSVFQQRCDCSAWQECDRLYMEMQRSERLIWRNAVKKPFTSGYQVYMKECVSLMVKGEFAPDVPSASGGYTADEAEAGTESPPPAICVPTPTCEGCPDTIFGVLSGFPAICDTNAPFSIPREGDPSLCTWVANEPPFIFWDLFLSNGEWVLIDGGVNKITGSIPGPPENPCPAGVYNCTADGCFIGATGIATLAV